MPPIQTPVVKSLKQALFAYGRISQAKDQTAIVTLHARWQWAELWQLIALATEQLSGLRGQRVGLVHRGDGPSWAALAALDELQADVFLFSSLLDAAAQNQLATEFRLAAVVSAQNFAGEKDKHGFDIQQYPNAIAGLGQSSVTILTSGTSGRPKAVRHSWPSLCRPVRRTSVPTQPVWLQTYLPNLYAGIQVSLQCLLNGGTLVSPGAGTDVDKIIELLLGEQVEFSSATPAYWRRLLMFGDATKFRSVRLKQITLGGEVVDQQVLDMLKATFPAARIAHIYATSELGRCFSVTDGKAGFPADWIGKATSDGVELKVQDGELLVRSPNAMQGYDNLSAPHSSQHSNSWVATGDLVKRIGDRYMFVGRRSDVINVGGHKVFPQEVEPLLRAVPGVADVRVYGQPSSLVGQLVAAQIVAASASEAETVKARVFEATKQLSAHQRPRLVEMVNQIALTTAGKIVRE